MRAHLIYNPEARGVTPSMTRVVEAALGAKYKLESTHTHARDAGIDVARAAVENGNEVIVAFGGDGLVNEVINGIAGTEVPLAIIPGGTMNVLARNLGIPTDPLDATDRLLFGEVTEKSFKPAMAGDRYFTFACGCGFDAEAAVRVENNQQTKRRVGEPYFYASAFLTFLGSYFAKKPFLRVSGDFGQIEAVMAIAMNGPTYAYLAGRPVRLGTRPAGEGIEIFTMSRLRYHHIPNYLAGALFTADFGPASNVDHSVSPVTVQAEEPFAVHVDGEPLDPRNHLTLAAGNTAVKLLI